jgi:hypothetical protein
MVLNACPAGRSSRVTDAGRALELLGVLAGAVVQRQDHVDAVARGMGCTELFPQGKASDEIRSLWAVLRKRLGGERVETHVA